MPNDELFHHGIDGQKWGVRHGPPYPLDREDHNEIVERSQEATKKRHLSYERSGKYAKRMTDKDLNDTIDRLQREETYRRLVSKEREEKRAAKLAKQAKKEADERYKNQNELSKKQQELQEQQMKANKKANSITKKVIENLLTKAASTAGTQVTKNLIDNYFKNTNTNVGNESNTSKKGTEPYDRLSWEYLFPDTTPAPSPSGMKFAGGDWNDDVNTVNNSLIALWPTQ